MQSDQATMVGESIVITGSLTGDEDLIILGRVEGTISLSRTLFVSTNGIAKADIAVDNAVISGVVVGNINATNSIQITETGRVVGDLTAPRVMITTGARVRGQVAAGEVQQAENAAATGKAAMGRNITQMYERMGLPARRPMAQPPVAARSQGAAQQGREGDKESSQHAAATQAQSASGTVAPMDADGAQNSNQPRRPQDMRTMPKKKVAPVARRRD